MKTDFVFLVQGSSLEPYVVKITLSPLSASCTCTAAVNGIPCKHRTTIMQGGDPGITQGDKSKLAQINQAAVNAGAFDALAEYDNAKAAEKSVAALSDKAFKKYRDAQLAFLLGQVKTDRAVIKAREGMEASIEALVSPAKATKAMQNRLAEFYKPPYLN